MRTRLKLGESQSGFVQHFQSMSIILSQAFGGDGKKAQDEAPRVPANISEAHAQLASVFGK